MLEIEIVESNIIDGGVEVFARAWRDGKQIGFGKDGSVDVERFRIFNPPILVPDPNGDIESVSIEPISQVQTIKRFREDPEEALLQVLEHNIAQVGKDGSKIVDGKVGNTTSTFYPSAGALDGWVRSETGSGWAVTHDATTGTLSTTNDSNDLYVRTQQYGANYYDIIRVFVFFDTSAIGTDSIDSATFSLYAINVKDGDNDGTDYITIVQSTVTSNTALTNGDFDLCGAVSNPTEGVDTGDRLDLGSISIYSYNDWTLNSTGIGFINKSGVSKFGVREGHDVENTAIASGKENTLQAQNSEYSGSTQDPKLVIVHSAGGGATANNSARRQHFMMM